MTPSVSAPIRRSLSTSWPESAHIRGPDRRERSPDPSVVSRTAVPNTAYSTLPGSPRKALVVISMPMTASAPANCASWRSRSNERSRERFHGAANEGISRIPPPYDDQP